ncbi:MAG TPA: hypothetical protein VJV74_11500 [Terriglobia bacterium]|nr:hypothetical protein [Terriglobia bacterium]
MTRYTTHTAHKPIYRCTLLALLAAIRPEVLRRMRARQLELRGTK